jgi:hypothetical protein
MNENVIYSSEASLKACRLKPYLALLIGPSMERPSLFEPGEKFPRGFCIMGDDSFAALTSSATEVEVGSEQHGIVPDGKFPIERFNSSSKKSKEKHHIKVRRLRSCARAAFGPNLPPMSQVPGAGPAGQRAHLTRDAAGKLTEDRIDGLSRQVKGE